MTMLECIHEQPKVLKRTIEGRKELAASFSDEFSAGSHDCIYLVASGTSRNASLAAAPFMEEMLGIPVELFTPLFAIARISGWCAHRLEELMTSGKIMRPAYRSAVQHSKVCPVVRKNGKQEEQKRDSAE